MTEEEFKMNLLLLGFVYESDILCYTKDPFLVCIVKYYPLPNYRIEIYNGTGSEYACIEYETAFNYLINN